MMVSDLPYDGPPTSCSLKQAPGEFPLLGLGPCSEPLKVSSKDNAIVYGSIEEQRTPTPKSEQLQVVPDLDGPSPSSPSPCTSPQQKTSDDSWPLSARETSCTPDSCLQSNKNVASASNAATQNQVPDVRPGSQVARQASEDVSADMDGVVPEVMPSASLPEGQVPASNASSPMQSPSQDAVVVPEAPTQPAQAVPALPAGAPFNPASPGFFMANLLAASGLGPLGPLPPGFPGLRGLQTPGLAAQAMLLHPAAAAAQAGLAAATVAAQNALMLTSLGAGRLGPNGAPASSPQPPPGLMPGLSLPPCFPLGPPPNFALASFAAQQSLAALGLPNFGSAGSLSKGLSMPLPPGFDPALLSKFPPPGFPFPGLLFPPGAGLPPGFSLPGPNLLPPQSHAQPAPQAGAAEPAASKQAQHEAAAIATAAAQPAQAQRAASKRAASMGSPRHATQGAEGQESGDDSQVRKRPRNVYNPRDHVQSQAAATPGPAGQHDMKTSSGALRHASPAASGSQHQPSTSPRAAHQQHQAAITNKAPAEHDGAAHRQERGHSRLQHASTGRVQTPFAAVSQQAAGFHASVRQPAVSQAVNMASAGSGMPVHQAASGPSRRQPSTPSSTSWLTHVLPRVARAPRTKVVHKVKRVEKLKRMVSIFTAPLIKPSSATNAEAAGDAMAVVSRGVAAARQPSAGPVNGRQQGGAENPYGHAPPMNRPALNTAKAQSTARVNAPTITSHQTRPVKAEPVHSHIQSQGSDSFSDDQHTQDAVNVLATMCHAGSNTPHPLHNPATASDQNGSSNYYSLPAFAAGNAALHHQHSGPVKRSARVVAMQEAAAHAAAVASKGRRKAIPSRAAD